ncbi:MAG TPA: adenylosuccinate lyase [Nitrospiria bacterium]|jgi:adenylosuccinate lyase|nr:adenylosuccinate lyase [Nitrospiria bacterium]
MIDRYTLPKMKAIWEPRHKLETWLRIELLACEGLAQRGDIPKEIVSVLRQKAQVDPKRMEEIERVVKHDVIAFLTMLAEQVGPEARYIHLGLTSSDILDTSLAILMQEAADLIIQDLEHLRDVLRRRAMEFKETVMVGRSHGVHGEPITFGLKLALWYTEVLRHLERMRQAKEMTRYGKLSGAMGTYAHLDPSVEEFVCRQCGLIPAPISNQIIQRDRHAHYLTTLALVASSVDKFATEIRHLQRTEVLEVEEFFAEGQKGSSAMPHKRNPIGAENLSGLARIVRSNAQAAMENVALWHERDISHSSVERVIIPDSTILVDYLLTRLTDLIDTLLVYPENMKANLDRSGGLVYSQRILLELAKRGAQREEAYEAVQRLAMAAWKGKGRFMDMIKTDPFIRKYLKAQEIDDCFEPDYYLRHIDLIYKRVFS